MCNKARQVRYNSHISSVTCGAEKIRVDDAPGLLHRIPLAALACGYSGIDSIATNILLRLMKSLPHKFKQQRRCNCLNLAPKWMTAQSRDNRVILRDAKQSGTTEQRFTSSKPSQAQCTDVNTVTLHNREGRHSEIGAKERSTAQAQKKDNGDGW